MMDPKPNTTRGLVGWALFDWANSPFTTLIVTFVFSVYFSLGIVGDEIRATQLWGNAVSISALIIAVMAPILGAIADAGGPRKPWLLGFTALCVLGSAMLWGAGPEERFIAWALIWFVIANVGFEFGVVFTNAMLPDLVPHSRLGRWSGWAWGLGYFGGLAAIIVALVAFVQADQPLFGLDKDTQEHVRVVGPLAAAWLAVFAIPLFLWTPDRPRTGTPLGQQISGGLRSLSRTLGQLRAQANTVRFLIARMIYTDGLITIFAMGGLFAAGTFGMSIEQVLIFGIVLNVTAGIGAAGFGWIDDRIGAKRTLLISVAGLLITAGGAVFAPTATWFWVFGSALGIFVGPAQAASRSMMARLSPPAQSTEYFGIYALTGKATAFLGPALVASITAATESQRLGLSVTLVFFVVGGLLLLTVRENPETATA
jgi:UMF1 family MFS transporter